MIRYGAGGIVEWGKGENGPTATRRGILKKLSFSTPEKGLAPPLPPFENFALTPNNFALTPNNGTRGGSRKKMVFRKLESKNGKLNCSWSQQAKFKFVHFLEVIFGSILFYVSHLTLCVQSHFMCPILTFVSHRILVFFLNTNFYRKNTFLRVFRFAEHEFDIIFSI